MRSRSAAKEKNADPFRNHSGITVLAESAFYRERLAVARLRITGAFITLGSSSRRMAVAFYSILFYFPFSGRHGRFDFEEPPDFFSVCVMPCRVHVFTSPIFCFLILFSPLPKSSSPFLSFYGLRTAT